jgi:hypothetical protein
MPIMAEPLKDDASFSPMEANPVLERRSQRGHRCCGGCCDMRRAVIVVNVVSICVCSLALIEVIFFKSTVVASLMPNLEQLNDKILWTTGAVVFVEMVLYGAGVYGACKYNQCLVGVAMMTYFAKIIVHLSYFWFYMTPVILLNALFAYPHYFLIKQIRSGILSEDNYPSEKYSCCCL